MTTQSIVRAAPKRGLILVVLAAALWGTSGVATKTIYSLVDISPISVAAFRLALGAPMLLAAYCFTSGSRSFWIARTDFAWMLLAGASLGISQACYFAAIARVGAALLLVVAAITVGVTVRYPWDVWALFLYLGLVPTALGYALFYRGVQNTTASEASVASLAEPLTSTLLAFVIFGERLGPLGLLGGALLISAIVFLVRNGSPRSG